MAITIDNVRRIFIGEVESVTADGPVLSATCSAMGGLFDRKVPRFLAGTSCNHTLFGTRCGVSKAAYTTAATIASAVVASTTVRIQKPSGAWVPGDFAEHFFATGLFTTGSGESTVQRMVMDSSAPDGSGIVTLRMAFPVTASAGASCSVHPWCDGSYDTCRNRFSNGDRFGGFPWMPIGNPSMVKVKSAPGGKK